MKGKMKWAVLLAAGMLCLAQTGWCGTAQGDVYVTPMFGGHIFEGNQDSDAGSNLDNAATYGLGMGYQLTDHWGAEAMFNYTKTNSDPGSLGTDVYPMHVDAVYNLFPDAAYVPYIAAGVGGIVFNRDNDGCGSDKDWLVNYGAGFKYFLTDMVALRADVRHLISFDDTYNNLLYTAGVMFNFGCEKPAPAPEPVAAPAPVKMDSDKDGVYDCDDACPDTPMGVAVDAKGCPLDTDGDGVADYKDECPNTPKGAHVDNRGCWVVEGVLFDTDKVNIKGQYVQSLDDVVTVMNNNPGLRFEIQGHTDNVGSAAYNQKLSAKRAWAVKSYLIKKGIAAERLTTKGFGFSNPAATNNTEEGRALNRRVEIKPLF